MYCIVLGNKLIINNDIIILKENSSLYLSWDPNNLVKLFEERNIYNIILSINNTLANEKIKKSNWTNE